MPPQPLLPLLPLLQQCKTLRSLKQIHAQILLRPGGPHPHPTPNHLLFHILRLGGGPHYALLHFSLHIPSPNDFAYNVLIRSLSSSPSLFPLALSLFLRMLRSPSPPNHFTYPFVLSALSLLPTPLPSLRSLHSSIAKSGFLSNPHVSHSLITAYSKCVDPASARRVFDEIPHRDLVSWNSMISGYLRTGRAAEAVGLFGRMVREVGAVDERTLASAVAACGELGDLEMGRQMEGFVEERGMGESSFVGSAMVDMYGKCGDLGAARRVFDGLKRKELAVWNAMLNGYAQNGQSDEAIVLFRTMRESGIEPDKITTVGVLSACASVGALELGSWLDDFAIRKGLRSNVYVGTALIDMYAKCGNLDRAIYIFHTMTNKNIVSWNAMISALASHGRGYDAIRFFIRMVDEEGIVPDEITFLGLLSACVHAGLVDKGRKWFDSMRVKFGVIPKIEHYSCMVDLLARAGHFDEAWEFIEKMPEKPDAVVLGSLLCACRNFKNVAIGERVVQKILELEPSNSGNYVISSKMYAGSKMWEDSARMRGLMRERGVTKTPGRSWMEINGQVHEFHAGPGMHLETAEIDWMVDMLVEEMKLEGYVPDTELV